LPQMSSGDVAADNCLRLELLLGGPVSAR